jgi:hypothetical protein
MPDPIQGSLAIRPLTKVAEAAAKDIYAGTKRIAAGALDKLLVEFGSGFEKYIDRNYHKCRYVKTLLHRIDPIPIEAAYVDPSFMVRKKIVSGEDFPEQLGELKKVVIVGTGIRSYISVIIRSPEYRYSLSFATSTIKSTTTCSLTSINSGRI